MKTEFMEKITAPVKPGEFLFALDVIDAIGNGNRPGYRFIHSIGALKKYIDDEGKVGSLNSRVWAFTDMLREDRVVEWKKGTNVHSALFVAAAELPMTDRASFHPDDFYAKVREIATQYAPDEIERMLQDGRREMPKQTYPEPQYLMEQGDWGVEQRVGIQRIGRNEPCPCGNGKKYKKCHGAN